jgi:hypothetical protein
VRRGRELFWQLPLFETHYSDLVTNFDIGVAGTIYAERRRSGLGLNEIWCMCRPAEFFQRYREPGLKERQPFLLWTIQSRAFGLALQLKLWFIELLCAKFLETEEHVPIRP